MLSVKITSLNNDILYECDEILSVKRHRDMQYYKFTFYVSKDYNYSIINIVKILKFINQKIIILIKSDKDNSEKIDIDDTRVLRTFGIDHNLNCIFMSVG